MKQCLNTKYFFEIVDKLRERKIKIGNDLFFLFSMFLKTFRYGTKSKDDLPKSKSFKIKI